MKAKFIESQPKDVRFKEGDYFMSSNGSIRQIVRRANKYAYLNMETGVTYNPSDSIHDLMDGYINPRKVEIIGFDRKTKEVLFAEVRDN